MRKLFAVLFAFCFVSAFAQTPQKPTTSEIYHNLQKLNFLGTALYVAAHPDDENTRLISYLANDLNARTGYLSMTRGDGGQNLIGPEIRELLGVIRTQELIAARRTDGGEQMFTRANDFGYSKHPDETLEIWNKEEVLGDAVRAIRKFKPDVVINRFNHRTPGRTHGHHTTSAMLSVEAFDLVGDASKYSDTAAEFGIWQPKRLFLNTGSFFYKSREEFDKVKSELAMVETGSYYTDLGLSNGEIASLSRSMHKSQGFGSTGRRGSQMEYLEFLKGNPPSEVSNIFEGINTSWSRIEGGSAIGELLYPLEKNFDYKDPSSMLPTLMKAYQLIQGIADSHWKALKTAQIKQLILDCGGIFLEAVSVENSINPKAIFTVKTEAISRGNGTVILKELKDGRGSSLVVLNEPLNSNIRNNQEVTINSKAGTVLYSSPYWLNKKGSLGMYSAPKNMIGLPETPAPEQVTFELTIAGIAITYTKDVVYKFNDPVKGEVYRPMEILPEVTSSIPEKVLIFSTGESKQIPVVIRAGKENISGSVTLQHPQGWTVSPAQQVFNMSKKGQQETLYFTVQPPKDQSEGTIKPLIQIGDVFYDKELITIDYDHIPYQSVLLPSEAKVVRLNIEKKGQHIGYIDGAGDAIPESLKQIGYSVTTIAPNEISEQNLNQYDAIVIGIRAYNTVPELAFKQEILNTYVENGGNLVVQYNTAHRLVTKEFSPYAITLSRDRVTDESSEVTILTPNHDILNSPNKITTSDFNGWVQERGLYFPNEWAEEFTAVLGMNDKNYEQSNGSLLVSKHGKGHYIYTGLSFFRELPAGVPGAYRLFANLLSIEK